MRIVILLILSFVLSFACNEPLKSVDKAVQNSFKEFRKTSSNNPIVDSSGNTIETRFLAPAGYFRKDIAAASFGDYLRNLTVLPVGTTVKFYDGSIKNNHGVYAGVLDISVGKRDLQQCADAVMRLRAEYLYQEKRYDDIHFNYTNGFNAEYKKWRAGNRIKVSGNKVTWKPTSKESTSYKSFLNYMDWIFMYAGTLSLSKELKPKALKELELGDVFIKGGSPGHAVIVVDVVENKTGEKLFLLAQSYMPAQQIQILQNPNNRTLSPWYVLSEIQNKLYTPEWTFDRNSLKTF